MTIYTDIKKIINLEQFLKYTQIVHLHSNLKPVPPLQFPQPGKEIKNKTNSIKMIRVIIQMSFNN